MIKELLSKNNIKDNLLHSFEQTYNNKQFNKIFFYFLKKYKNILIRHVYMYLGRNLSIIKKLSIVFISFQYHLSLTYL